MSLVDVGAGVGPVAFTAGSLGRQVYAVEPIASRANAMCKTVTDFNYKNVHIIHNAVSDERVKVSVVVVCFPCSMCVVFSS